MFTPSRVYPRGMILAALALVSGCALFGPGSPVEVAQTPAQKGYAIEASYNVILEDALAIGTAPSTTAAVKKAIKDAEEQATPVIEQMSDALVEYEVERARFEVAVAAATASTAGPSEKAARDLALNRLTIVTGNLDGWIKRAQVAFVKLYDAFKKP